MTCVSGFGLVVAVYLKRNHPSKDREAIAVHTQQLGQPMGRSIDSGARCRSRAFRDVLRDGESQRGVWFGAAPACPDTGDAAGESLRPSEITGGSPGRRCRVGTGYRR
jgi:hypothetical protein